MKLEIFRTIHCQNIVYELKKVSIARTNLKLNMKRMVLITMEFDQMNLQMNFMNYLSLSKRGVIRETKEVLKILTKAIELSREDSAFYKVIASQIRLLICDKDNSLLFKLIENPELPDFTRDYVIIDSLDDTFRFHSPMNLFDSTKDKIAIEDWLQTVIMSYVREDDWLPRHISEEFFTQIMKQLKPKSNRPKFQSAYKRVVGTYSGKDMTMYVLKENVSEDQKVELCTILDNNGYNSLTVFDYIKLWGDKSGSHIDSDRPIGMTLLRPTDNEVNYLNMIGVMLIDYTKTIISELS